MANNVDTLQRAYDNYCRIWLLVTEIVAGGGAPTQAQVDALTSATEGTGAIRPKITVTEDGATYNWTEYQQALNEIMTGVRQQMVYAGGPFEVRSRGR